MFVQNMPDFWYNSIDVQAGNLSQDEETDRTTTQQAWSVFAVVLTVPAVPVVLLLLWRFGIFFSKTVTGNPASSNVQHSPPAGAPHDSSGP